MKIDFSEPKIGSININDINDGNIVIAHDSRGNCLGDLVPLMLLKRPTNEKPYVWISMQITSVSGITIKDAILKLRQLHREYEFEVY